MKFITAFVIVFVCFVKSFAADTINNKDSLIIKLESHQFKKNDTIYFECEYKYHSPEEAKMTLNVIIENVEKTKQWRYRYPLLQGNTYPILVVDSIIDDGRYAINFIVQKDFLKLEGKVKNFNSKSKGLNYLMLGKNKASYISLLSPEKNGNFSTPKLLFEDTAQFVFSEIGTRNNYLFIDLKTSIDSIYSPIAQRTEFITIGEKKSNINSPKDTGYAFDIIELDPKFTLKEVVVNAVKKKKVELFDEQYATNLFKFGFPIIFDGLESHEIGNSMDIFSFLQGRAAGLNISRGNTGNYNLSWRGGPVDVFLDEMRVDDNIAGFINTNDIAMVKVFPPMSGGPTGNGSIAIYTKRGGYSDDISRRYYFKVIGYSPQISTWK
jgi:hypothetical protein